MVSVLRMVEGFQLDLKMMIITCNCLKIQEKHSSSLLSLTWSVYTSLLVHIYFLAWFFLKT